MSKCMYCKNKQAAKGSKYCSPTCEIADLKNAIAERDDKLARLTHEREPECLAQVRWSGCIQEWYTRDSYDAKRRANELRKQNFEVEAKHIGQMRVLVGANYELIHVTILTAWSTDDMQEISCPKIVSGLKID